MNPRPTSDELAGRGCGSGRAGSVYLHRRGEARVVLAADAVEVLVDELAHAPALELAAVAGAVNAAEREASSLTTA